MGDADFSSSTSFKVLQALLRTRTPPRYPDYSHLEGAEFAEAHERRRVNTRFGVYEALEEFEFELWSHEQVFVEDIPVAWDDWRQM